MTLPSRIDQVLDLAREAMALLEEERAGNYNAPRRWVYFDRVDRLRWDLAGDEAAAARERAPHSRACGWQWHPHGVSCSADCPTCHPVDTDHLHTAGEPCPLRDVRERAGMPTDTGSATVDPDSGAEPAPKARP